MNVPALVAEFAYLAKNYCRTEWVGERSAFRADASNQDNLLSGGESSVTQVSIWEHTEIDSVSTDDSLVCMLY